jgi:hypothetical protein
VLLPWILTPHSLIACLLLHALQRERVLDPVPHQRMGSLNRKQASRVGVARAIVNVALARGAVREDLKAPVLIFEGCTVGGKCYGLFVSGMRV